MKAGVASAVITPTEPMWLAGWAARREPASGPAMDLKVKALVLEDDDEIRAIIVTADLIAIPRGLIAKVEHLCGLARETIIFNSSHTHCGPELRPDKVHFFEIPMKFTKKLAAYWEPVETALASVISNALNNLEPVTFHIGEASAGFAHNRRDPNGPVDRSVPVLKAVKADGSPLAIVFGYACHNLTLPPTFCQYHGDYSGLAQLELEKRFPTATTLFLSGAGADQDPEPRGTAKLAAQHGHELAEAVAAAVENGTKPLEGDIKIGMAVVSLDYSPLPSREALEKDLLSDHSPTARKARFLLDTEKFPSFYPCPMQVLKIGPEFLIFALSGEPVVDYALRLKREFPGKFVWVAGYCNDMFGYLPSRRIQLEGGYEGGRALLWSALPAPFTDTVEERIMEAAHALADAMDSPDETR